MSTFIDLCTYESIVEQAAIYGGSVLIEAKGYPITEIRLDPEFAKKEWEKMERWRNMRIVTEV